MRRTAIALTAAVLLVSLPARAEDPSAALLVTAGEGVGTSSLQVVRSTVSDLLADLGYGIVPVPELEEAVKSSCTDPSCSTTGEPAVLLASLEAPLLVILHLEEEGEEVRIDISIHDLAGRVQKASNVATMSAVLAKSVKLLLDVMPEPGSLPPAQPPEEDPGAAVSLAIHDHHHTSPCSGQSCSGHGRCIEVQGLPACACDEGYAPDTATGLSCRSAIYEPPLTDEPGGHAWGKARRLAIAGSVLDALGLLSLTGGWIFAGAVCGDPYCTMMGFIPGAALMHGIGGPLKLHGLAIANKSAGQKPAGALVVAGWIAYGLTLASLAPMPFAPLFMSEEIFVILPIFYTALHLVSATITYVAGGTAIRRASAALEEDATAALVPYAAPVPGGITLGLAGSF